jgi:murein DD-endopeptidase MepM/ murein hydrolase activator NlpD
MTRLSDLLAGVSTAFVPILDETIPWKDYTPLDLSMGNPALKNLSIADPEVCQAYIDGILMSNSAQVAYGGYLEKRNLYAQNTHFQGGGAAIRNIHLGVDFWAKAGTSVVAPLNGTVHSFRNNAAIGDYGPTIVLQHTILEVEFYSLYGHLSLGSLDGLFIGKPFRQGDVIGRLGTPDINVNYAPHLHFQLIQEIGDHQGDYPGVCTTSDVEYYQKNCPNPLLLLHV